MKRFIPIIAGLMIATTSMTACAIETQADRVSYNVSQEADNFNVIRRLTVINLRSDKPVFELVAAFSINVDGMDKQLEIVCETGAGEYKKHFVDIAPPEIMYFVEDISGASVSKYHYEVNFQPKMIVPIVFVSED